MGQSTELNGRIGKSPNRKSEEQTASVPSVGTGEVASARTGDQSHFAGASLPARHAIGDFSRNNLDMLRLALAGMVFLFHMGDLTSFPAFSWFANNIPSQTAVKGFFVISGLLIYRSYSRSRSLGSYFDKRVRRIYPAYFTVIVLAALSLVFLSSVSAKTYFGFGFWKYLAANLVFLNHFCPALPGVFAGNNETAVNGALWTLKIEWLWYLSIPIVFRLAKRFGNPSVFGAFAAFSLLWRYGFSGYASAVHGSDPKTAFLCSHLAIEFPGQLIYFLAGVVLVLYFDRLRRHLPLVAVGTVLLFAVDHFFTKGAFDVIWISGAVLIVGFWRYLGNFSKYGDFSYGVYIVHWPILQVLIATGVAAAMPPWRFFFLAVALVVLAATLLWHLVEKRFLRNSSHYRQAPEVGSGGHTNRARAVPSA